MAQGGMIRLSEKMWVPSGAVRFQTSRSGGPGGQHVNKANTRVAVLLDLAECENFSQPQKQRILRRLRTRANKEGVIRVVCQRHRSQKANRDEALQRLGGLLAGALKRRRRRKKTKVPRAAKERRLKEKRRRSELKEQRKKVRWGQ